LIASLEDLLRGHLATNFPYGANNTNE
jgi:hypothetical protein